MIDAEASKRAHALCLEAVVDVSGWHLLVCFGVSLEARGSSWEEAFERLEQKPEPQPEPMQRNLFD